MAPNTRSAGSVPAGDPQAESSGHSGVRETLGGSTPDEDLSPSGLNLIDPPSAPEPIDEEAAIRARHAELQRLLARKRLEREAQAMEDELNGREPTHYVEVAGTTLPSRKRPISASMDDESHLSKYVRLAQPPKFDGKSIEGLRKYEMGWNRVFRTMPQIADDQYAARIAAAATYLEGRAEEAWERDNKDFMRWEDYITYLKSVVATPAVRKSQAISRLYMAKQQKDQKVQEYINYIETIEADIPPMGEDERRAWIVLNGLEPAIRAEVMHEHREILSREQVVESAIRHEEILAHRKKTEQSRQASFRNQRSSTEDAAKSTTPARFTGGNSAPRRGGARPETSARNPDKQGGKTTPPQTSFDGNCFNCGEKGHRAANCPNSRRPARESQGSQQGPKN